MRGAMRLAGLGIALLAFGWGGPARAEAPVTVFAAASLVDALHVLDAAWAAKGHPAPVLSLGASGALARQIMAGAPADVFISADSNWMNAVEAQHLVVPGSQSAVTGNTLVLVEPRKIMHPVDLSHGFAVVEVLGTHGLLSIGNPASVPAGAYAKQALTKSGTWDQVSDRLALASDVRAALLQVSNGAAPAGIVYGSDAKAAAPRIAVAGTFPASSHDPITYPGAALTHGNIAPSKAYLLFLGTPEAQHVFATKGFAAPTAP